MRFVLKMAWRDSRASRGRLMLFSLSVVLGIAALVAIGSFSADVRRSIDVEAKGLLGADIVVTAPAVFPPALMAYVESHGIEYSEERMLSSMMVFPGGAAHLRLVQVRAVDAKFPFYGDFVCDPANAALGLKDGQAAVVIEPTLMKQFGVQPGDSVRLGKTSFRVVGGVLKVPGESPSVAMLAPRAFISLSQLAGTGLASSQSLSRYRLLMKLPPSLPPERVVSDLKEHFADLRLQIDTVAERKKNIGRALENIDGFLSLVGFVALFLGGIGVASAVHVYVRQKISTVAVLRCLGASAAQSFSVYVLQGVGLGVVGSVLGGAVGVGIQWAVPRLLNGVLPFDISVALSWSAILRGTGAGLVICVLFTLLPLLSIRKVSPLVALRSAFAEKVGRAPDPYRVLLVVVIVVSVIAFAIWQTGSIRVGLGFAAVLAAGFGILGGLATAVTWASRHWVPRSLPYVVRQGVANLHRPNNRTVLLLLSLGLGTFLILTLLLSRTTLLRELVGPEAGGRANLIFFDVQDDQIATLDSIAASAGSPVVEQAPIVTMKLTAIRGKSSEQLLKDRREGLPGWALRREYRSSYRGALSPTETLASGSFVGSVPPGTADIPISIEESLAKDLRLKVGDSLTWDVQGVPMQTHVGSIRTVEWRRMEPNFFIIFPTGALEDAPKTYVAALKAATPALSANLQSKIVGALPNVSAIDLGLVAETLDSIFSKIAYAVEFMALFTIITGLVVLMGSVLTGRYQRIRETVLLRTLGSTRRQLVQISVVEYAVLGILAAAVGSVMAVGANLLVAHFILHARAAAPLGQIVGAFATASAVTLLAGFLANRGIADHPPLEVLRQET